MTSDEAVLYLWLTEGLLPGLSSRGVYAAPDPAPLTTAEVRAIFERVAEHKSYRGQVLVMATLDEEVVEMQRGEINVTPVAGTLWEGKPQVFPRQEPGGEQR